MLTPTEVAHQYAISSGLLYGWRQKILGRPMTRLSSPALSFAQDEITAAAPQPDAPEAALAEPAVAPAPEIAPGKPDRDPVA